MTSSARWLTLVLTAICIANAGLHVATGDNSAGWWIASMGWFVAFLSEAQLAIARRESNR